MITAVSNIRAVQKTMPRTEAIRPDNRLEFLQHKDVFFSAQSYRAQVTHFLTHPSKAPLMFGFYRQDKESAWGKAFPPAERDILLAQTSPAQDKAKGIKPETAHNAPVVTPSVSGKISATALVHSSPDAFNPITRSGLAATVPNPNEFNLETPIITMLKGTNPFAAATSNNGIRSGTAQFKAPQNLQTELPRHVKIVDLFGKLIAPRYFQPLEQAFSLAGLKPETPTWVQQTQNHITALQQNNPQQAGFQKVSHPWMSFIMQQFAKWLAPLLGLKVQDQRLVLPNGDSLPLNISSWRDGKGKPANLYEVMKLPDGRWFKVDQIQAEQAVPLSDQKTLRQTLEGRVQKQEQNGKVREMLPLVSTPELVSATPGLSRPFHPKIRV